jgi:hypothetical protein
VGFVLNNVIQGTGYLRVSYIVGNAEVNWRGREADHSSPYSGEVKIYLHLYVLLTWCLITKRKDSFKFTFVCISPRYELCIPLYFSPQTVLRFE